jgi:histidyl-tRNA synthetase
MGQKPNISKGTRDFNPEQVRRRDYLMGVIRKHFQSFGFQPIETPSFEQLSTLMGQYGEEGDRLIFKILNSGDYLSKANEKALDERDSRGLLSSISEKALRYDLTVPFARYVVMHQNELTLPFKRYQIQPVWRADRPQKGRFREFYQCDADVVGSNSLWQEVELLQIYDAVFTELGMPSIKVKLNHRRLLAGIAQLIGEEKNVVAFTVALDKLDKIGREGVEKEMLSKGIDAEALAKLAPVFELQGTGLEKLASLADMCPKDSPAQQGIEDLKFLYQTLNGLQLKTISLDIDLTLARGLHYYTGVIFEVSAPEGVKMGSIGGGGRYDDLTGQFGLKDLSGVGISFGLDRIYLVLEELCLFPEALDNTLEVLALNLGEEEAMSAMKLLGVFRAAGLSAELYPQVAKMQKQFKYADKRGAQWVLILGTEEREQNCFLLKDMAKGEQHEFALDSEQGLKHLLKVLRND